MHVVTLPTKQLSVPIYISSHVCRGVLLTSEHGEQREEESTPRGHHW